MMKKSIRIILTIVICLFSVSCGVIGDSSNDSEPDPHKNSVESYHYEQEQTEKILEKLIECFDNKDKEGIKALFTPQTAKDNSLDSQIDKAFEIYDGKSLSYEIKSGGIAGSAKKDGVYTFLEYDGELKSIKTDTNTSFSIWISRCVVNDDEPNKVGLTRITLCRENGVNLAPIGDVSQNETFYNYDDTDLS